jgi:hypothetical protein
MKMTEENLLLTFRDHPLFGPIQEFIGQQIDQAEQQGKVQPTGVVVAALIQHLASQIACNRSFDESTEEALQDVMQTLRFAINEIRSGLELPNPSPWERHKDANGEIQVHNVLIERLTDAIEHTEEEAPEHGTKLDFYDILQGLIWMMARYVVDRVKPVDRATEFGLITVNELLPRHVEHLVANKEQEPAIH